MPVAVRRLLVVLAVAGAGFVPAPATAAGYCSGAGVNVVVDFGGGDVEKACGSGSNAADVFRSAGFTLTPDQQFHSVVCKIDGRPGDANCVTMPASNAYWGLFWSDGKSGDWVYSTVSADGLKVSSGGFVGFAWQSSDSRRDPSATPSNPRPTSNPTPAPTRQPTEQVTKQPTAGAGTAPRSGKPSASATGTAAAAASGSATSSASPTSAGADAPAGSPSTTVRGPASAGEAGSTALTPAAADDGGGGLAWWVPVAVLVGLAGGGGAAWWTRRRSSA